MNKTKLGLVGLGCVGRVHLQNCLNLKSAELVAASDISKKALDSARKMGVKKTYEDYEQLLNDSNIDAVIIALPTHLHACCAKKAADAGKHIVLEKPLARNVVEGKDILSAVRKNGVKLMVGYPWRFFSRFQALKQKVKRGELGEVQMAHAINISSGPFFHRAENHIPRPVPDWWFKRELTGGGALMDLGSHMINLVRWYLGEISNVKSYMGYRFSLDLEDFATCVFKFQTGQIAVINVGWFSQRAERKIELFGTVAHASAADVTPNKIRTVLQLISRRTRTFYIPYLRELQHFTQCIAQDLPPSSSGEDALKDLEAIELAYKNQIRLD